MMLAGQLLHRTAQTVEEQEAAHYIARKFRESITDVRIEEFNAPDSYPVLFASYYTEFLVVSIAAWWMPFIAAGYGLVVLGCYLAEYMGINMFSRLLPEYPSQNVVAHINGLRPKGTLILHAYYDSPVATPLFIQKLQPWHRLIHGVLLLSMVIIVASCFADGYGWATNHTIPVAAALRWSALGILLSAALFIFLTASQQEHTRGANNNASGVTALLELGRRMAATPREDVDILLVASGSHGSWMSGIRYFLKHTKWNQGQTCFINLEALGSSHLYYSTREGTLHSTASAKNMIQALEKSTFRAIQPAKVRNFPTATQMSMNHGIPSISILGLDDKKFAENWYSEEDMVARLNEAQILTAVEAVETAIRTVKI